MCTLCKINFSGLGSINSLSGKVLQAKVIAAIVPLHDDASISHFTEDAVILFCQQLLYVIGMLPVTIIICMPLILHDVSGKTGARRE
jgi:uncharacterized membrane protein